VTGLRQIPFVDIRGGSPVDLLRRDPQSARDLARAAMNTLGFVSRAAGRLTLPYGDRASRAWLERCDNPYLAEIRALDAILGMRGVFTLNVCFEWGCTSGVWRAPDGAVLRRVLDWAFPALGEHLVVAHQSGDAGDFLNITWPGINGIYQALAPGRFAAAINQAPMRRHGAGFLGDWLGNRIAVKRTRGLPPAHLLRRVFERAPDYQSAKAMLCEGELAVPAIYILSGVRDGEGVVIERSEKDFALREIGDASVCAANHFQTRLNGDGSGWRPRPIDSVGRARFASALTPDDFRDDFSWFMPPVANTNSRLAFNANAATGALSLMGTAGAWPVTEVFHLPG
jgi:hypothetical protein